MITREQSKRVAGGGLLAWVMLSIGGHPLLAGLGIVVALVALGYGFSKPTGPPKQE